MTKTKDPDLDTMEDLKVHNLRPSPNSWEQFSSPKASAVLCLFIKHHEDDSDFKILLTKRSTKVSTHKGQIGFPGGHKEDHDAGPVETALRETEEEIGLKSDKITIHGSLDSAPALSGKPVVPIIGSAIVRMDELSISDDEVDEVFFVPVEVFLRGKEQHVRFNMFGIQHAMLHKNAHIVFEKIFSNILMNSNCRE